MARERVDGILDPRCGKFGADREVMLAQLRAALNRVYREFEAKLEGQ